MPDLKDQFSAIELWIQGSLEVFSEGLEERTGLEPARPRSQPVFKTGAVPLRFTNPKIRACAQDLYSARLTRLICCLIWTRTKISASRGRRHYR